MLHAWNKLDYALSTQQLTLCPLFLRCACNIKLLYIDINGIVTVHTPGRDEEHADEEVLQNNSLY